MKHLLYGLHTIHDWYEWNRLPNSRLFAVIKIFDSEKLFGDFVFSSASSLSILAFCI